MQILIIFLWTEKHMAVRDPLPDPLPRVNTVQAQDIFFFFFNILISSYNVMD